MRNASSFDWDDAAIARLTELWLDGITSGEIGRLMGISRSGVMGKLRRLNLLKRDDRPLIPRRMPRRLLLKNASNFEQPVSRPQKRPHSRNKRPVKNPETYFLGFRSPPPPPPPPPAYGMLNLLDLRHDSCRWPEGERPDYRFCGRPKAGGSSYCPDHHARSMSGQARGVPFYLAKLAAGQG